MLQCENCGQVNNQNSNFCRFCGTKFMPEQHQNGGNYEFSPPRPYVWKTDEFQISESKARKTQQVNFQTPPNPAQQPFNNPFQTPQPPQALAYQQPQAMTDYRCPRCSSQLYPRYERRISQTGWITFAVLLVAFFPLFWIGFLIKEDIRVCPVCGLTIGSN